MKRKNFRFDFNKKQSLAVLACLSKLTNSGQLSALFLIIVSPTQIKKAIRKKKERLNDHHEMTIDVLKNVPQILEDPIIVMQSKTRLNSIALLGEVYPDNMPVLVAMQLNPKNKRGRVLNFAKIASAYGDSKVQGLINTSDILYINPDKEKTILG
ncbi:hypothetical protein NE619_08080 [Anaerovorax odorimutans]|uniref:Phage MuF C-terminal domain-containing protein n=1 Tax=Anaerovorax odorimutans TaxID=109327 RepID=A0ABT1RNC0_9FIRM|nr:hypothetical protein [Anaerovorax odorimutans]MCQ4636685.1 hypothetical protein [Anaerovorax odorimutans]